jgi:hypothetical protein
MSTTQNPIAARIAAEEANYLRRRDVNEKNASYGLARTIKAMGGMVNLRSLRPIFYNGQTLPPGTVVSISGSIVNAGFRGQEVWVVGPDGHRYTASLGAFTIA